MSEEETETIRIIKIARLRLYANRARSGLPIFDEDLAVKHAPGSQTGEAPE